jgi:hypothetical protein
VLNAARYASAFNAVSPLPIILSLVALWAAFTPRVADTLDSPISGYMTTMRLLLLVLVGAGMLFLLDQARSPGCAKSWAEMLADAEKEAINDQAKPIGTTVASSSSCVSSTPCFPNS